VTIKASRPKYRARKTGIFVALFCLLTSTVHGRPGLFAGMAGSWSGEGRIEASGGPRQRIRCRASNDVDARGLEMRQRLRCRSARSYFDVASDVIYRDGTISGTWSETTHNVIGQIIGTARRGRIRARIYGGAFTARLTVVTVGNLQRVTITPRGFRVRRVAVTLRRS
jgi:hypothetical protein